MYLFRTNRLVEDFQNDAVSQKDTMKYLILFLVGSLLINFCYELLFYIDDPSLSGLSQETVIIKYFIFVVITITGGYLCYRKNYQGDNKLFIERFICIAVPVSIRIVLLSVAILFIQLILNGVLKTEVYEYVFTGGAYEFFFDIIIEFLFFYYMTDAFDKISNYIAEKNEVLLEVEGEAY